MTQRRYIERIADPKTPEDLILALKNPYSSVFKTAASMEMEGASLIEMVEILLDKLNMDQVVSKREKEEMILAYQLKQKADEELHDLLDKEKIKEQFNPYKELETSQLRAKLEENTTKIESLSTKLENLEKSLATVENERKTIQTDWAAFTQQQKTELQAKLATVDFVDAYNVKIPGNSEEGQRIIAALTPKEPEKVIDVIFKSLQLVAEAEHATPRPEPSTTKAAAPPPPPPPPFKKAQEKMPDAQQFSQRLDLMQAITLLGATNGLTDPNFTTKETISPTTIVKNEKALNMLLDINKYRQAEKIDLVQRKLDNLYTLSGLIHEHKNCSDLLNAAKKEYSLQQDAFKFKSGSFYYPMKETVAEEQRPESPRPKG